MVSNTTTGGREGLSRHGEEAGGLSGRPLFAPSTAMLAELAKALDGQLPIIGVGGVGNADDAYMKIVKGASLVQLYTALVFKGPDLVWDIVRGLDERLAIDGFDGVQPAIGAAL